MKKVKVVTLPNHDYVSDNDRIYDLLIATIGFESRACHISKRIKDRSKKHYANAFDSRHQLAFDENFNWFKSNGFSVSESSDSEYGDWVSSVLAEQEKLGLECIKICVDISSTSRLRLALLFEELLKFQQIEKVIVDFLYSPAKFSEPKNNESQMVLAKPVTEMFAGWTTNPELPTAVIIGLGYEQDKGIGIIEYLEPTKVWAFRPRGGDIRYERAVDSANETFWEIVSHDDVINYSIENATDCFNSLQSVVSGTLATERPILIPFGPKIFAACCFLVSSIYYPKVSLWRVSSDQSDDASDSIADGRIVGISAEFTRSLH